MPVLAICAVAICIHTPTQSAKKRTGPEQVGSSQKWRPTLSLLCRLIYFFITIDQGYTEKSTAARVGTIKDLD